MAGLFRFGIAGVGGEIGPEFFYAVTSASAQRKGLYLTAISGSPPVSLEPRVGQPEFLLEGDLWFEESGSAGDGNLFIAERSVETNVVIAQRIVTSRENETTIDQIVSRFTSSDAPLQLRVGANAVVIDNFYVTVNSASLSGSLVRNDTWGGGVFMSDENTVAVQGTGKNWLVPSGSSIVEIGSFTIQSGSANILSGNIILQGDSSSFDISGSSISASLLGNPIISVLTGSISSESLSPVPIDGTLYIDTSSSPPVRSIRASGTFFQLGPEIPDIADGGIY